MVLFPRMAHDLRRSGVAWVVASTLLVASAVAYLPSLDGEFQFDDEQRIERNVEIKDIERFGAPGAWALPGRPLTNFTLALNYLAGRLDPFGYHVANLVIHLAAAALVFLLSRRALRTAGAPSPEASAGLVAGVFALHPIQTESVSYVIQRAESLASLLFLAALLLLLQAERMAERWRAGAAYGGAVLAALGALAAKPVAATLPAAYLLYAWAFPAEGARVHRRVAMAVPLLGLSAFAAWQGLAATEGSTDAGLAVPGLGLGAYLLTQSRVVFRYLALIAWPAGQTVDPDVAVSRSIAEPATMAAVATLLAFTAGSLVLLRRGPALGRWTPAARLAAFGFLWFLLVLAPSSLVPLADVMAEHRVYLACWGPLLAAVAALSTAGAVLGAPLAARALIAAALLAALTAATWARNEVWSTRVALWTDAVEKSPAKARPHAALGWSYALRGDHRSAVSEYRRALALGPVPREEAEILRNMGSSLAQLGLHGEAAMALAAAARHPDLEADARALRAMSLAELGLYSAAHEEVVRALRLAPNHGAARNTLGQVYLGQGDPAAALQQFRIAVSLNPDVPVRRWNLALTLERLGRVAESCVAWREYVQRESVPAGRASALSRMRALGCDSR